MVEKTTGAGKLKWWMQTMLEIHAWPRFQQFLGSWAS